MTSKLTVKGGTPAPFETVSSTKASEHNLIIEPGDPFSCTYLMYSINEFGAQIAYDVGGYTITATANSLDFSNTQTFVVTVSEEVPASGIKNKINFTLTAAQTIIMAQNSQLTWGMRFTDKIDATKTFTFMTGIITAKEGSEV